MYDFIEGEIDSLTPTSVVLATAGVGYVLQIGTQSYHMLVNAQRARLYVHQVLREDCNDLFGFASLEERTLFRMLLSVSGVGANTARMMLSAYEVSELADIIAKGDEVSIRRVKGVGTKTAQRVIVDLHSKVSALCTVSSAVGGKGLGTSAREEALAALQTLGFQKLASEKVLDQLLRADGALSVEQLIKQALKQL